MSTAERRDAIKALKGAGSVAFVSHRDPDGDTVGSALALGLGLEGAGKRVSFHCADPIPEAFGFLRSTMRFAQTPPDGVDLITTVDFGDAARAKFDLPRHIPLLNIDHHATNDRFGSFNVVEPEVPATAQVVAELVDEAGLRWTGEMATAALLGLMTDTGSFQFPATSPASHRTAARLLEVGADLPAISQNVFRTRPFTALKIFGRAFDRLERECDGRLVHTWVLDEDLVALGAKPEDVSGLIEQIARSAGMRVAILFNAEHSGEVKVSIRTSAEPPNVDAAALAAKFGGGGHVRAAGALVAGSLDAVRDRVLREARAALD
ncbi:MAG: bifunctional oligoribonuclease/PAP phosphatase NrnA [Chloroflexi bacterium]|nr:MAG: bifunctional oligoribonuclease/PAP phosphatase NrnA [Chloroflexota bacterium]